MYQYDSLGQVISGQKYWQNETPVGGMQFGYAFDDTRLRRSSIRGAGCGCACGYGGQVGNRTSATTNGREASYTANALNEYAEATVPGAIDVLGTANSAATVTVNRQPVTRTGAYYSKTLSVNNSAGPVWQEVKVVGVRKNAGPDDKDVVTESVAHEFVPQTPEAFTYDDDGNLTTDGRWAYTWDGENCLIAMETLPSVLSACSVVKSRLEFLYDGQSRRIEKKVYVWDAQTVNWSLFTDHLFLYDGWNLIAELNANDLSLVRKYCWGLDLSGSLQGAGGGGGLLSVASTMATQFTAYDGNGNVVALIDAATGAEAARYEYDPFGNTLVQTGAAAAVNPFRFSTKYTDAEAGLLYYGLRYYSPRLGRWISRDPIGEEDTQNLSIFLRNDPTDAVDYVGMWFADIASEGKSRRIYAADSAEDSLVSLADLLHFDYWEYDKWAEVIRPGQDRVHPCVVSVPNEVHITQGDLSGFYAKTKSRKDSYVSEYIAAKYAVKDHFTPGAAGSTLSEINGWLNSKDIARWAHFGHGLDLPAGHGILLGDFYTAPSLFTPHHHLSYILMYACTQGNLKNEWFVHLAHGGVLRATTAQVEPSFWDWANFFSNYVKP